MRKVWTIAQRELRAIFTQPIAYVVAVVLLFITGLIFVRTLSGYVQASAFGQTPPPPSLEGVMGFFTFISLFVAPAITMRLLAEEQRSGTIEVLMTLPVRDGQVVLGKFLAALIFFLTILLFTLVYPLVLLVFGNPDTGLIFTTYLGTILALSAMLGIGIFASALAENQIVAYVVGFGIIVFLYLTDLVASALVSAPAVRAFFSELSFNAHIVNFSRGLIVATDVLYFVGLTAIMLFAAARVLESRRWR